MKETIDIKFDKFRTDDGKPTCAFGVEKGSYCRFLGTRRFGVEAICLIDPQFALERMVEEKGGNGLGHLIPCESCMVWKCEHPNHNPPEDLDIPDGERYIHVCPNCKKKQHRIALRVNFVE
jgi:hypothetical protein